MKHHSFHEKNRCKNCQNFGKKKYTTLGKRQNRRNSAVWGRFATRNCDKESSHDVAKFFQDDGDDQ